MSATISTNTYDKDIELVCDRCDVKISNTEKGYSYELEIICEECDDKLDLRKKKFITK